MASASLCPYSAVILFLILCLSRPAGRSKHIFTRRGRSGQRHLLLSVCGRRAAALNRRNEKKALSAAASFFPLRLLLWGLKGASSPFLVDPAHRNRYDLAALNTRHLLRKPVCGLKAPLGLSCPTGTAVLSGSLLCGKRERIQRKCLLKKAQSIRHAPALCSGNRYASSFAATLSATSMTLSMS